MAKINRNNTFVNKHYEVILFTYCVCIFSMLERNLEKHINLIIYFHKYSVLFKMSTVYYKEIMCYTYTLDSFAIFVNVPFN